ncbi:MAG: hypothetical protein GF349_02010 [Candidatus Magasanikbacteria bacterium]|nr:hypothetical protein [Candidatus Magasanikbacteria bacterium]
MQEKGNKFKINFIGVGTPRSGTTWISKCLSEHSQICFSKEKETHFFDKDYNFDKGLEYYRSFFENKEKQEGVILGEFTPSYYRDEKCAKRIKTFFPDVKIILCLRNPVDRALSDYRYNKKRGAKLGQNLLEEPELNLDERVVSDGFFYNHLEKFLIPFNFNNIHIILHKDIKKHPDKVLRKLYDFLGVNNDFIPSSLHQRVNTTEGTNYRYPAINRIINYRKKLKNDAVGRFILNIFKLLGIGYLSKKLIQANKTSKQKNIFSEEEINNFKIKLFDVYLKDINKLEDLIKKDLSIWKQI